MPKRKTKEEKPRKKVSRKQILIPPIAIGAATLAGLLIMQLIPPPPVLGICLKLTTLTLLTFIPQLKLWWTENRSCCQVMLEDNLRMAKNVSRLYIPMR